MIVTTKIELKQGVRDWGNESLQTQVTPSAHHVMISHHSGSLVVRTHPRETCWPFSLDMGGISPHLHSANTGLYPYTFDCVKNSCHCPSSLLKAMNSPSYPQCVEQMLKPGNWKKLVNALVSWILPRSQVTENLALSFRCVSKTVELTHGKWNVEVLFPRSHLLMVCVQLLSIRRFLRLPSNETERSSWVQVKGALHF